VVKTRQNWWIRKKGEKTYDLAKEILLYFIEDSRSISYSALDIGCSCIAVSREILNFKEIWHERFEEIYNIKFENFKNCYETVKSFYLNFQENKDKLKESCRAEDKQKEKDNIVKLDIVKSNPTSIDKKKGDRLKLNLEIKVEEIEKINSYRGIRENPNRLLSNEKNIEIKDSLKSDHETKLQMNKLLRIETKMNNNNGFDSSRRKQKLSVDITPSDLIYKTRLLLLKSDKLMNDEEIPVSSKNEKENNLNQFSRHKYNSKYNYNLHYESKNIERNISSNIRDLKTNSTKSNITNFEYKKCDKTNNIKFNSKEISKEKLSKDYSSRYKDLDSKNVDKISNNEIVKNIDREIYSRQKYPFAQHLGSGNSKENNFLPLNHYGEFNDILHSKINSKPLSGNRNVYFDYKYGKHQD